MAQHESDRTTLSQRLRLAVSLPDVDTKLSLSADDLMACADALDGNRMETVDEAKRRIRREVDDRIMKTEPRPRRYALQTPSGNIVGMGTEKPQLSRQDKRLGWRVIALGP